MANFPNSQGRKLVLAQIQAIVDHKVYLSEIDGKIGDGDHGTDGRGFFRTTEKSDVGEPEPRQHGLDVVIVRIEVENAFRLPLAFLLDNGFEQLLLVFEIHIERPFGDAGGARDVVHAGGVEALSEEDRASAFDDLAPFGAVLIGGGREPLQRC